MNTKPRRCKICKEAFDTQNLLTKHNRKVHPKPTRCSICKEAFDTINLRRTHIRKVHPKPTTCTICKVVFKTRSLVNSHTHSAHPKPTRCTICKKMFDSMNLLSTHRRNVHPKPSTCTICKTTFDSMILLRKHNRKVHPKPTSCKICEKKFDSENLAASHTRSAHPKPTRCKICKKMFDSASLKNSHSSSAHPKKTTCRICNKTFDSESLAASHRQYAHPKQTTCKICEKVFKSARLAFTHTRHAHPKPSACKICEVVFKSAGSLDTHRKKVHPRPGWCTICKEVFKSESSLNDHRRKVHPRPVRCTTCKKVFKNRILWQTHKNRVHPRINIPCRRCKLIVPSLRLVFSHCTQVHREKRNRRDINCPKCGVMYKHRINFEKHVQKVHGGNKVDIFNCQYDGSGAQPTLFDPCLLMKEVEKVKDESKPLLPVLRRSKRNRGEPVEVVIDKDLIEVVYENELVQKEMMDEAHLMEWKSQQLKLLVNLSNDERQASNVWGADDNERWRLVVDIIKTAKHILPHVNPVGEIECLPLSRLSMFQAASFMCNAIREKNPTEKQRCSSFLPQNCGFVEDAGDFSILEHLCNAHYRENSPFVCRLCQSGHSSFVFAAVHLHSEHFAGDIICPTCHVPFDSDISLGRHNVIGHIQDVGQIFVSNVSGIIDRRQYIAEDNYVENGGMFQLYLVRWMDETGQGNGVSVSFTKFPDVRLAARNLMSSLRKAAAADGWAQGCSARSCIPLGWTFDPEEAIVLGIYARSERVICQLKWWVRLYLNAICVLCPEESRRFLAPYNEILKNVIQPFLQHLDQGTQDFVVANIMGF